MVKIEVNHDGACTEFHDDMVDVRLVTTFVGDGTVIADNTGENWEYYDKYGGFLPQAKKTKERSLSNVVKELNAHIVASGDLTCHPGDIGVMKGGKMTKRPCLHRAPYSSDAGSTLPRFLVTVDRMHYDTLQEFLDMDSDRGNCSDCSDCSDESSREGKDEGNDKETVSKKRKLVLQSQARKSSLPKMGFRGMPPKKAAKTSPAKKKTAIKKTTPKKTAAKKRTAKK